MELLKNALNEMGIDIDENKLLQFSEYKRLLLEWNEKINLTAITDEREILLKHFADCASVLAVVDLKEKSYIDVGTGAGFPGLPLKIMLPSAKAVLLDSLNKRINFLNEVVKALELKDISCVHMRAEDGGQSPELREGFDFCVSRAVARLSVLSEYCIPFIKVGGEFVSLKGPDVKEELSEAQKAVKLLGCEVTDVREIQIPFTDIKHSIISIKKLRQTPSKYPRKSGKITKNPII